MPIKGRQRGKSLNRKKQPTTRCGRQRHVTGTMEGLQKKAVLLHARLIWDGSIPRYISHYDEKEIAVKYAEYPLGILFARKIITIRQHDVGILFDKFRRFSGMKAPGMCAGRGGEFIDNSFAADSHFDDEESTIRAKGQYRDGLSVLTPRQLNAVQEVACYGDLPRWITLNDRETASWFLRSGLNALISCYVSGGGKKNI